jgi:hypothetical protein
VGIATEFDPQVGPGAGCEITCHDGCCSTQKGEWRATHAAIPKRDEFSESALVLFGQNGQWVGTSAFQSGLDMGLQGDGFPLRPSGIVALGGGEPEVGRFVFGVERRFGHADSI